MPRATVEQKICPICGKSKAVLRGYYRSSSPLHKDGAVPVCTSCVKKDSVNKDGSVNPTKFKIMCQRIDKPYYTDYLNHAFEEAKNSHKFMPESEVATLGDKIIGFYFKDISSMPYLRTKTFSDSEKEGFVYQRTNNLSIEEEYETLVPTEKSIKEAIEKEVVWSEQDNQNKNYAIEVVGYDPFDKYPEEGRKFLYNQLSPYLEDDSNVDDAYKLSQILQIIKNNYQIDTCDKKMSQLDPLKDADSIKTLSGIKNQLVQSNDKIAKENEISVRNRSDKAAGKSTLTYLMRDLREKDFDKAEADYYDQLRGVGTRWAVDMSITSIKQNGMFDENDKKEIYEMQLDLIDSLNQQVEELKEKVRLLQIDNDRLKAGVADGL